MTAMVIGVAPMASAQDAASDAPVPSTPSRPEILSNRWQEDWSALADPALRTEPFDALKYIPLLPSDPKSYMSAAEAQGFLANELANMKKFAKEAGMAQ